LDTVIGRGLGGYSPVTVAGATIWEMSDHTSRLAFGRVGASRGRVFVRILAKGSKRQNAMAKEEILHKRWRIDVMPHAGGWKALIYRPGSTLAETTFPTGQDRALVIEKAKSYIDGSS
jgi:hypothetical protein